jgi:hypothetical protein
MDELIKQLREIRVESSGDVHVLMGKSYLPIDIEKKNFHVMSENDLTVDLTFIDGGQAILFESAGFCLGFIRVAVLSYSNNRRVSRNIEELYVLITENENSFLINTFPAGEFNNLKFDPENESLRNGMDRASPSRILSVIRRFAELKKAQGLKNVILDGTLEARYPHELEYINRLESVSALSKTCSLTTNIGVGITNYLRLLDDSEWYYTPIVKNNNKNHSAEIYFVKLNKKSDYVFRFEHKGIAAEKIMCALQKNSTDPVFLGYPYGLVDVDNAARVTEQEKKMLQTQISVKLGKEWFSFSKMLKSMNAHEILDNIRF